MYILVSGDEVDTESVLWGIKEEENIMELNLTFGKKFNHHSVIHF